MKQESLVAAVPRRRRYGSYMGEIGPAPENLLQRAFSATAPNQKWLTDISEFQLPEGKVYLSPMIDCFDGMVVSWSISFGAGRSSPSRGSLGSRGALPLARMANAHCRCEVGALDVTKGLIAGQCGV